MTVPLSDLIVAIFGRLLEQYGDPDLAAVATAAVINELLTRNVHHA